MVVYTLYAAKQSIQKIQRKLNFYIGHSLQLMVAITVFHCLFRQLIQPTSYLTIINFILLNLQISLLFMWYFCILNSLKGNAVGPVLDFNDRLRQQILPGTRTVIVQSGIIIAIFRYRVFINLYNLFKNNFPPFKNITNKHENIII